MGWNLRFWRRLRVAPGVTVNMARSGPSVSVGPRGAKTTVGRGGMRRTLGIPGTGIFATSQESWDSLRGGNVEQPHLAQDPDPAARTSSETEAPVPLPGADVERCGFCGGRVGLVGRCEMCDQPAERWRDA